VFCNFSEKILSDVQPKSLLICNANRSFELSLWIEANKKSIKTVLLPYQEIELHPARFLSLCHGNFDMALVLSDYSAKMLRKLNSDLMIKVVGFPTVYKTREIPIKHHSKDKKLTFLYIAGSTAIEIYASKLLKEIFYSRNDFIFKLRLHPSGQDYQQEFDWVPLEYISNPRQSSLINDINDADVLLTIGSTVAIDAIFAKKLLIWLTPEEIKKELTGHPLRSQTLSDLEILSSKSFDIIYSQLKDEKFYNSAIEKQLQKLNNAGYNSNYFDEVSNAIKKLIEIN
jgi:hypothetical protein